MQRVSAVALMISAIIAPGLAGAGITVGLDFVSETKTVDFMVIPGFEPSHFVHPCQLTDAEGGFVLDGGLQGVSEGDARNEVLLAVREDFYSLLPEAGVQYEYDIEFVLGPASGTEAVNVLLGSHEPYRTWLGYAKMSGALNAPDGESRAVVSYDRIADRLEVIFDSREKVVSAVSQVISHEVGHLLGLKHVIASEDAFEYTEGDVVVADPYDLMSSPMSGLPDHGYLQKNEFTDIKGTQGPELSSKGIIENVLNHRKIGDLDGDGAVSNIDLGIAFGKFGQLASTTSQGDVDHDGVVTNSDLGVLLGAFDGAASGEGSIADLIYDPATGGVILDGTEAPGGIITNFVLVDEEGDLTPTTTFEGGFFFTNEEDEISWTDGTAEGLSTIDLGEILPADMTLAEVEDMLETATYVGELGSGVHSFEVIPEPATMSLLAIGGLGALIRRKRR